LQIHNLASAFSKWRASWKRGINTIIQKPKLWASKVDWKKIKNDTASWIIEALIEGFTANIATHYLLGVKFNPMTILAHGIVIKQGIDIYWRLRKDGPTTKLPQKNK